MAGRTDAGVHARGQVASFRTTSRHGNDVFTRGANALLPQDIAVRAATEVPLNFDPRRHASSRWYRYTLYLGPQRPAIRRHFVWHVTAKLDTKAMGKAARLLEGRHDLAAFTTPSEAKRSITRREVSRAEVSQAGTTLTFDVEANAFLRHMVRRMVGTLVGVGVGRLTVDEFKRLIEEAPPGEASWTAPSRGLCLVRVRYESRLFDDEKNEDF